MRACSPNSWAAAVLADKTGPMRGMKPPCEDLPALLSVAVSLALHCRSFPGMTGGGDVAEWSKALPC